MADQPNAVVVALKIQHVIALRKAIVLAMMGTECPVRLSKMDLIWLSEVERMLWPARPDG